MMDSANARMFKAFSPSFDGVIVLAFVVGPVCRSNSRFVWEPKYKQ